MGNREVFVHGGAACMRACIHGRLAGSFWLLCMYILVLQETQVGEAVWWVWWLGR